VRLGAASRRPVTRTSVASHEVNRSTEYYKCRSCRPIGLPTPAMSSLFPAKLRGIASTPAPFPLRVRVHPLVSFISSTECVTVPNLFDTSAEHLPRSFSPHRDIGEWSPPGDEVPRLRLRSAHSVSHTLDDLLLHSRCRLISSHSHVQDSLFRGFPRCQADPPHRRPVPSCQLATFSYR